MKKYYLLAAALLFCNSVAAHELTPTYPTFKPSYVNGVYTTSMKMWNRRQNINYYIISVFDENWKQIPFATSDKLIKLDYLESKRFDIYIRNNDLKRIKYICTTSKMTKDDAETSNITSRICSKVK